MLIDSSHGLLIKENNYSYPVLVYDVTRADIDDDQQKAKMLRDKVMAW